MLSGLFMKHTNNPNRSFKITHLMSCKHNMLTDITVLFFFKMLTLCKSYIIIDENVLISEEKTKEKRVCWSSALKASIFFPHKTF